MKKREFFQFSLWFLVHPALHAVAGIVGIAAAILMWWAFSYASLYRGLGGLVAGMLIGSAILLAAAGFRLDGRRTRPPA